MKQKISQRSAITLIETLVVISLSVSIILILGQMFVHTIKIYRVENSRGSIQLDNKLALERITRIGQQSALVKGSISSGGVTYKTSSHVLILGIPSVDASQNIRPSSYDYFVYRLNPIVSTELEEIVIPDATSSRTANTRVLADAVSNFSVSYLTTSEQVIANIDTLVQNGSTIPCQSVQLTLQGNERQFDEDVTVDYKQKVTLRNY